MDPVDVARRQIQRRKRHFVRFEGDPPPDSPSPRQVNVTATVPRSIEVDTIAEVLEQQRAVMTQALQQLQELDVGELAKAVMEEPLSVKTAGGEHMKFERTVAHIQTVLLHMLQQDEWRQRVRTLRNKHREYAFAVKLPRESNSQMFSSWTFSPGDVVLYRPTNEEVVVRSIQMHGAQTEYVVDTDDNRSLSVLGARLLPLGTEKEPDEQTGKVTSTRVHAALEEADSADSCIQHLALPLYNMRPVEYPHSYIVNLLLRPDRCSSCLPTARDMLRLARASLFYADTVVVAISTFETLTIISLYPTFVKQLAACTPAEQQNHMTVLAQNANVCRRRYGEDPHAAVEIYRYLLTPGEQKGDPVAWLAVSGSNDVP
jgi:hypothetical protein